ncbi:MAG: type II toxin-antitoxin system VapB family antitoxin [Rhodoglobus sp.]
MTRTLIDVDDAALAAAAKELGTTTKVDTVNRALAEIAARGERLAFLEHMRTAEDDLGNPEIMAGARR